MQLAGRLVNLVTNHGLRMLPGLPIVCSLLSLPSCIGVHMRLPSSLSTRRTSYTFNLDRNRRRACAVDSIQPEHYWYILFYIFVLVKVSNPVNIPLFSSGAKISQGTNTFLSSLQHFLFLMRTTENEQTTLV